MASIWVTGASGFIGRHLSLWLAGQGHQVIGIGYGNWTLPEMKKWGVSHWLNGEINNSNLSALCSNFSLPDAIFHLAGGASVGQSVENPYQDFHRTVVTGIELLEWMRHNASEVPLVAVSSAAVYGAGHEEAIPESAKLNPFSPYGFHKMMMETSCQSYGASYGIKSVIVRLFSVYGSGLHKQLLWDICQRLYNEVPILKLGGTGNELRDWTEITDVVRLLDRVTYLADASSPVINGGSGIGTSIQDIANKLVNAWNIDIPIEFSGKSRPGDPKNLISMPSENLVDPFAWEISIAKGIPSYVDWFREEINESR